MTVFDMFMTIGMIALALFTLFALTGISPSKLYDRARGIDPYAGVHKNNMNNDYQNSSGED